MICIFIEIHFESDEFVQNSANCQLTSSDILTAIGTVMGKKKTLINALVAEGVTAWSESGTDQNLKANWATEIIIAGDG